MDTYPTTVCTAAAPPLPRNHSYSSYTPSFFDK